MKIKTHQSVAVAVVVLLITTFFIRQTRSVESKIRRFEKSLSGPILAKGDKMWTLQDRMEHYKVPGMSIAVINNYKVEWTKAYGFADAGEKRVATPQTFFQAASISKSLNAVGVLKLVQDRRVSLDSNVNIYLKSWKLPSSVVTGNKEITIGNLLSHTAGLSVHGFSGYSHDERIPTVVQMLDGVPPSNNEPVRSIAAPGEHVIYSGGGTMVSQLIVTDVTGLAYDEYMKVNVLEPLDMKNSFYNTASNNREHSHLLATGYRFDGSCVEGKFKIYPENAAAGLWTTPSDLSKFVIEMQRSVNGESNRVLSKEFAGLILSRFGEHAGLGAFIVSKDGEKYFQHGGANEGFRCQFYGSLDKGYGVVVMINSNNGRLIDEVITSIGNVYEWKGLKADIVDVALTNNQMKPLEGFYNAREMDKFYLQILVKENRLTLRQLWDGMEITFTPKSDTTFEAVDREFSLGFSRDANGNATQLLALGKDVWIKDNNYRPVTRTRVFLPPLELKHFEGKYELKSNRNLVAQVSAKRDHLLVKQLWNGKENIFVPQSRTVFFVEENPALFVRFTKNAAGEVSEVVAIERETFTKLN